MLSGQWIEVEHWPLTKDDGNESGIELTYIYNERFQTLAMMKERKRGRKRKRKREKKRKERKGKKNKDNKGNQKRKKRKEGKKHVGTDGRKSSVNLGHPHTLSRNQCPIVWGVNRMFCFFPG